MKYFIGIILTFLLLACEADWAPDCFQKEGEIFSKTINLPNFEEIEVHEGVELFISKAPVQKVTLETGENLVEGIDFKVIENRLVIKNKTTCNYVRDYKLTKVYVESPNLNYIRNAGSWTIKSLNALEYENLRLVSEDANREDAVKTDGDFDLTVKATELTIVNNALSDYFLKGSVAKLSINFYSGDGRMEAENLIADQVSVYHRGSNDIIVNPQNYLQAKLLSTGNLIAKNQPPETDIEILYTGTLIFD